MSMVAFSETELQRVLPLIPWREPVLFTCANGVQVFCCRICMATKGLKGEDLPNLPRDRAQFEVHLRLAHAAATAGD